MSYPHPFKGKPEADPLALGGEEVDTATVADLQGHFVGDTMRELQTMKLRLETALGDTSGAPEDRRAELQELVSSEQGSLDLVPKHLKSVLLKKHPEAEALAGEIAQLRMRAAMAMTQLPSADETEPQ